MKKSQFKALVREIIRGIVTERSAEAQQKRAAKKERERQAGQADLGRSAASGERAASDYDAMSKQASATGDVRGADSSRLSAASARRFAQQDRERAADPAVSTRVGRRISRAAQGGISGPRGSIAQSPTLQTKLAQRPQEPDPNYGGMTPDGHAAQAGLSKAAATAAQKGLKRIPNTVGLYSSTGQHPAEWRSWRGELVPVKSASTGKLTENKSLSLRTILMENAYNRVNLMKIGALMEKALPELTKDQSKKLTELFTELSMMSTNMNGLPYTVKEYKLNEWQLLIASFHKKLDEFRSEVMNIHEKSDKVNCAPLIKALDEVLTY